ncbi:MAG TPA: hypothetical protein PKA88_29780 [Polyangiaceae bacterium]|nr:hypothetical protein [Polyangiaceae bacterium]
MGGRLCSVALLSALAWSCGPDCSNQDTRVDEYVDGAPAQCTTDAAGACGSNFCAQHCPVLKGTDNADIVLDSCEHQGATLVCSYTRSSEWCG